MNLNEHRETKRRQLLAVARRAGIAGLVLIALIVVSARLTGRPAAAEDSLQQTDKQQQAQDMKVMLQNAAVWTDNGLVVLQGNRLLHYSADMQLRHTIALPLGKDNKATPKSVPQSANKSVSITPEVLPALRSNIPAQIIAADDGLIVVRGQQVIRLDSQFKVTGQAALPNLPKLTPAELAALFPINRLLPEGEKQRIGQASELMPKVER